MNEGLLEEDENAELLTETQVGRMIHTGNLQEVQRAIYASFVALGQAGDGEKDNEDGGEPGEEKRRYGGKWAAGAGRLDTARLLYIAMVLLGYREREAWRKHHTRL